jgi:integrase
MPKTPRRGKAFAYLFLHRGKWWTKIDGYRESTGLRKPEIAAARVIRDRRLADRALRRAGVAVDPPLPVLTVAELLDAYLKAEANPYDRDRGGEQAGTLRSSRGYRLSRDRVLKHLDNGRMPAASVDAETIITLAEGIAREESRPSRATRRKHLAFLRRVFSWAAERPSTSGIRVSPFSSLTRQHRRELFPKARRRGYVFTPDQLVKLYALAGWRRPLVRFAAHTGMRLNELVTLRWACVDLKRGVVTVEARYAKNGHERDVPLGGVAAGILAELRRDDPGAVVFTKRDGSPVGSIRTWWLRTIPEVWTPSKPSEDRPRFHDLRKTCGTRVESVSSHAVAKRLLGHADGDVTDSYLLPTVDDVRAACDRAAARIDGVVVGIGTRIGTAPESRVG